MLIIVEWSFGLFLSSYSMPMQVSRLLLLLLRLMQLPRLVVCFLYYYVAVDDPGFRFVCLLLLLCGVTLPEFCCAQSYAKKKGPENGPNGNWHPISGSQSHQEGRERYARCPFAEDYHGRFRLPGWVIHHFETISYLSKLNSDTNSLFLLSAMDKSNSNQTLGASVFS